MILQKKGASGMKVLIVNGSPHKDGNTMVALRAMMEVFEEEGAEYELFNIADKAVEDCRGCGACSKLGRCVIDDAVNEFNEKFENADGIVIGSPVYYAAAAGRVASFPNRVFYSAKFDTTMKVGCCFCAARRGGIETAFDQINKYFTISGMPIASSRYWNGIHGSKPGEAEQDLEGISVARILARNMCFLMKSISLGKETYGAPKSEKKNVTNFIR